MRLEKEIAINQDIHKAINKKGLKVKYTERVHDCDSQDHLRKVLAYIDLGRDGIWYSTFLYNTHSKNLFNEKRNMRGLEAITDYELKE